MMSTRSRAGSALLAILFLPACALSRGSSPFEGSGPGEIQVVVQNNNYLDGTVYLTRDGTRMRLGTVIGKTDQTFTVEWAPNQMMVLRVDFVAGGACQTRPLQMEPGQRYTLELQPDIRTNIDCIPVGAPIPQSPAGVASSFRRVGAPSAST
jgi:hypothetical protein